jgi:hypothetical protein
VPDQVALLAKLFKRRSNAVRLGAGQAFYRFPQQLKILLSPILGELLFAC